jgi:hypothetical protein
MKNPKAKKQPTTVYNNILSIAETGYYFLSDRGEPFVDVYTSGKRITCAVSSKQFQDWLRKEYYQKYDQVLNGTILKGVVDTFAAKTCQNCEPTIKVWRRVAEHEGCIYIDLCNEEYEAVEVTPDGWRIITNPPTRFQRLPEMKALPKPQKGDTIKSLLELLNLADENDAAILVAFCVHSLQPAGPYPILILNGPKGSSKSTLTRLITSLIDPNLNPLRSFPRNEQDLAIAFNSRHLAAFDNISNLSQSRSDSLARAATGGSFSARKLYSDTDQISIAIENPLILNGIPHFIKQPDLEDRCLFIQLSEIRIQNRMTERDYWSKFDFIHSQIFGLLLDGLSKMLSKRSDQNGVMLGRMADFHANAIASETAFWPPGTFDAAYQMNKNRAKNARLKQNPVAAAIVNIVSNSDKGPDDGKFRTERTVWTGSVEELLYTIHLHAKDNLSLYLPDNGMKLGHMISNCTELLFEYGIRIQRTKSASRCRKRGYSITLTSRNESY